MFCYLNFLSKHKNYLEMEEKKLFIPDELEINLAPRYVYKLNAVGALTISSDPPDEERYLSVVAYCV